MQEFEVKAEQAGMRTDVFVAQQLPEFTRSSLERLFDDGLVMIGDKRVKASQKVQTAEKVMVDASLLRQEPPKIDLPIIYEDDGVVVINKPAGILSHSKGALNTEATVASFIKPKINDKTLQGNRAGIVHRLDRATSGVIIAAKSTTAQTWLQKQFSTRKSKKTYLAVVEGHLDPAAAVINAPIQRNPARPQTFRVNQAGQPAQTEYKVLREFEENGKSYSVLELKPLTGRTHQLRVHLSYIGHPIVGDWVYGHEANKMLLHAYKLELTLPNKERKVFEAPVPDHLKKYLDE